MSAAVEISILIVAISILIVSLLGSISFILLSKNISEFLKKKNKIDELNLYDQVYNSRESIEMMLDEFIGKQFDEYKIFNPDIFFASHNAFLGPQFSKLQDSIISGSVSICCLFCNALIILLDVFVFPHLL